MSTSAEKKSEIPLNLSESTSIIQFSLSLCVASSQTMLVWASSKLHVEATSFTSFTRSLYSSSHWHTAILFPFYVIFLLLFWLWLLWLWVLLPHYMAYDIFFLKKKKSIETKKTIQWKWLSVVSQSSKLQNQNRRKVCKAYSGREQ